jgi:5-methyltetrahydrofolate--homocysteine methyltransferase
MMEWISAMKPYATVPLAAKPNAGIPRLVGLTTTFDMDANAFGAFSKPFAAAGVNLLGGCCGTTPDHIGALKRELGGTTPVPPQRKSLAAVSSARGHAILDRDKPLYVIGERINPTGKKALQEELREGKTSLVRQMAREQEEQGADLLDVNVGVPGIDEPLAMKSLLGALAGTTGLPLVIDSPKVDTIAAALRLYPGRALLNSISGEREKMEKLLPLAARYGAMFILLPLLDGEIPETAAGRSKVVRDVYRAAQRHGFTKEDIIVDGLVMTVAANPNAPVETLKTVTWCSRTFGSRTVLGVSNVSFGMPERKWLNASFLVMAQAAGLSAAIVNPANLELTAMKKATDVFLGKDRGAAIYIESFREGEKTEKKPAGGAPLSPSEQVHQAIIAGNRDDIVGLIAGLMNSDSGLSAAGIVEKFMIPAILRVGDFYEQKTYFLPQLIASAEAMKKGLDHLEPLLREAKAQGTRKGVVLLATVQGDIHDIGKNIVALMLRNYGYDVIDLGKDVATKNVIEHIKKYRPDVVGLSALMTTTMIAMKDVMELARREGLTTPFILGGAVVTEAYATSLGAAYARDGVEAVRVLEKMLKQPNA